MLPCIRNVAQRSSPLLRRCSLSTPRKLPLALECRKSVLQGHRRLSTTTPRKARYLRFSPDPAKPFDLNKWDPGTKVVAGLVILSGLYYVMHLETVPETGRWRFMDVSPKYEAQLAESTRASILQQYQGHILPPDHPVTVEVTRIVARILESSNLGTVKKDFIPRQVPPDSAAEGNDWSWDPDSGGGGVEPVPGVGAKEWMVLVVNDMQTANASAAFGTIVVFTGLLPICKDEHGVATVLGHEIGHVVARHSSERYSSIKVFLALGLLLEALGLEFGIAKLLTTFLMELPNSRKQELEADQIGVQLMAKACFDPSAAPEFMVRLATATDKKRWPKKRTDFLDTHPASHKRIQLLEGLIPEAHAAQAANPECAGMHERLQAFFAAKNQGGGGDMAADQAQESQRWT